MHVRITSVTKARGRIIVGEVAMRMITREMVLQYLFLCITGDLVEVAEIVLTQESVLYNFFNAKSGMSTYAGWY